MNPFVQGILKSSAGVHSSNASEGPVLVHHILDSSLESGDKAAMLRWLGQHVAVGQHQHVVALMGLVEEVAAVSLVFQYHTSTLKQHLTDARAITHYPVYADKHRRFSTISEQQVKYAGPIILFATVTTNEDKNHFLSLKYYLLYVAKVLIIDRLIFS